MNVYIRSSVVLTGFQPDPTRCGLDSALILFPASHEDKAFCTGIFEELAQLA